MSWPNELPVAQVRIARPTDQLAEVRRFYAEGIGLPVVGGFEQHDGYDGLMLGLPGVPYHLEFTQHVHGSPCPAPSLDNLLVLYIPNKAAIDRIVERLGALGYHPAEPENKYWAAQGITIPDPDGWRVVLMNWEGIKGLA